MSAAPRLRLATLHDAEALAALARRTFCETFSHYAPDGLARFLDKYYTPEFFADALRDPETTLWLAEVQGEPIAYAKIGAYKLPLAPISPNITELHRLYVRKDWHGKKLGAALMEEALATARAQGADAMYLGVWEKNKNAQGFYARYGFAKAGEYDYEPIGDVTDREWIMVKELQKRGN